MIKTGNSRERITLVFDSLFAYRSYSESGVHAEIAGTYETSFLFIDNNSNNISEIGVPLSEIRFLKLSRISQAFLSFFATVYWQKRSKASNSFRVRITSLLIGRRLFYTEQRYSSRRNLSIKTLLGVVLGVLKIRPPKFLYMVVGKSIRVSLKELKPNLVIYVTLGGGIGLSDILKVASDSISTKTLVLMDNWDNIYSKAVFNFVPNHVTVWNLRARDFASTVHQIPMSNMSILPSSRLIHLIQQYNNSVPSPEYVLFAGGSMQISYDARWLGILHEELRRVKPGLKVKYLPHPLNYQHLSQIESLLREYGTELAWQSSFDAGKVLPPLTLYPQLFRGSLFVVSPLSTISLEAAILGIDSIGIDFFDYFEGSVRSAFEVFEHYWDLKDYPNFNLVKNEEEFRIQLQKYKILDSFPASQPPLVHSDYKQGLLNVIQNLIRS